MTVEEVNDLFQIIFGRALWISRSHEIIMNEKGEEVRNMWFMIFDDEVNSSFSLINDENYDEPSYDKLSNAFDKLYIDYKKVALNNA